MHLLQRLLKSNLQGLIFCFFHSHINLIRLESSWGCLGPTSPAELQQWVSQIVSRLDSTQRSAVKGFLRSAASYSTAYGGCGFFESIVWQLTTHLGVRAPRCTHGWEVQEKARLALMGKACPDGPEHIFGDLMSIFPTRTIRKLFKVQKVLRREHCRMVKAGHWTHAKGVLTKGLELLQACDGLLSQARPSPKAWCFKHRRFCVIPTAPLGSMCFHAAGSTCVDFSQRSSTQLRLLGPHMVVFASWAWSRRLHMEHLILHECVVHHPSAFLLRRYLGSTHLVISWVLCPSLFGHPCTRRRRFTLALHRSRLRTPLCRSPEDLFRFTLAASGDIYFSALPVEVDSFLAAKGILSWRELLAPGALRRRMR